MKTLRNLFVIGLVFSLAACSTSKDVPAVQESAPTVTESAATPRTVVLSDFAAASLQEVQADGTLIFASVDVTLAPQTLLSPLNINSPVGLEAGVILTSAPTQAAPAGLLRKVESVREVDGFIYVATSEATLDEALAGANAEDGTYVLREEGLSFAGARVLYDPEVINLASASWETPTTLATAGWGDWEENELWEFGEEYCFDKDILELAGVDPTHEVNEAIDLNVKGCVEIDAFAELVLDIQSFKLEQFVIKTGGEVAGDVTLDSKIDYAFDEDLDLASFDLGNQTFWVAGVPITIGAAFTLTLDAEGQIDVNSAITVIADVSAELGTVYTKDTGWDNINDFDYDFDFEAEGEGAANVDVALDSKFTVYLYGMAGFGFGINPYITADVSYPVLDGELHAGVRGEVHFEATAFEAFSWEEEFDVIHLDLEIDEEGNVTHKLASGEFVISE